MGLVGWKGKLYQIVEFITMLAVLQLMWIGLTLLGLVFFGIAPATAGLFASMRKRLNGEDDLKTLVNIYRKSYRKDFFDANKIGITIIVVGYFIVLNIRLSMTMNGVPGLLMLSFMVMACILYAIILLNIFSIFVHYELPFTRYFSVSLLMSISFPVQTIGAMLGLYGLYRIFLIIPGLLPFFGISVTVLFLTWVSSIMFKMKGNVDGSLLSENEGS